MCNYIILQCTLFLHSAIRKKDIRQFFVRVVYPHNLLEGDQYAKAKYFNVMKTHNEVMNA